MLQHAFQERLWGIYEAAAERLSAREDRHATDLLRQAAALVRKFYEDLHQRLEEQQVFPHFQNHAQLGPLVKSLRSQHTAGRAVTDKILALAGGAAVPQSRPALVEACRQSVRSGRPHVAREATELFQALYDALPAKTLEQMAAQCEKQQDEVLGEEALKGLLAQITAIEKELI
jgi:hypothetical protein